LPQALAAVSPQHRRAALPQGKAVIVHQILRVTWQVAPLQCPLIRRHCSRCKTAMPFACSMKFRTNAHKKRIDVWLIYRCSRCDATWNLPIHERVALAGIPADAFQAIARNDPDLARRYALDHGHLAQHGILLEEPRDVAIRKTPLNGCVRDASLVEITLALASPCGIRLDRLLASELGVPRSQLRALHQRGALQAAKPLRAPIADGQVISITLSGISTNAAASIRQRASE
jgi:hypothetical protein